MPLREFKIDGVPLARYELAQPGMCQRINDDQLTEYLVRIRWIKAVERGQAFFERNAGLFTTQQIRASLSAQPKTIAFIEESFGLSITDLLDCSQKSTDDS
jgi:hypothetical protein